MATLLELKQGILRKLAWSDDKVGLLPIPLSSTAESADLLSLRDTKLARGTHGAGNYNGRHIEITSQPTKVDSGADTAEPVDATEVEIDVDDSTKFAVGDAVQIDDEIMGPITALDTSGTDITVTRGIQGTTAAEHLTNADIYLVGPAVGEIAAVDVAGFDLTDKLITSPAFTGLVVIDTDYLLYPRLLVPETVADAINGVLKKTEASYLWAPSLVADSDMGADDLTKWPAVGVPATREFVTTAAHVLHGPRSLHLVGNAGIGAQCTNFDTHEGEPLLVSTYVKATYGKYDVILYDEANNANIKAVNIALAVTGGWVEVRFQETIPSATTKSRASLHFVSGATSSVLYVSPHVIVQGSRRTTYDAPSWLVSESQVVEMLYLPSGYPAEADDAYIALSSQMRAAMGLDFLRSDRDVTPMRVTFANQSSYPVYLLCKRPFAELSALTDTTSCDEEFVVAKAAAQILKDRGDGGWWVLDREAEKRALKKGYGGRELRSESPTVLV